MRLDIQMFNMDMMRKPQWKPSLFETIRLWFRPMNYSNDGDCTIWFKELDGKRYIKNIQIKGVQSHGE